MKVEEVMTREVVTAQPSATVKEIADLMSRNNVGTVVITDQAGKLQGLVTDRKLVTDCVAKGCDPASSRVEEIMTRDMPGPMGLVTASPDMDILDAARKIGDSRVRRLPVVDRSDRVLGIISAADVADSLEDAVVGLLEELSKAEK